MLKKDKIFLESLVPKDKEESEMSLKDIVAYKQYQYQNIILIVKQMENMINERFGNIRDVDVYIEPITLKTAFNIRENKRTDMGQNYVDLYDDLQFNLPKRITADEFNNFALENEEFFVSLINELCKKEITISNDIYIPSTNNKYALKIHDKSINVVYNHDNIDIQNYNLQIFNLTFNGLFTMNIDFLLPPKKPITNDFQDYCFWSNNKLREYYYRRYLELGIYNDQIINPFDAIIFDQELLPPNTKEKIKTLVLK